MTGKILVTGSNGGLGGFLKDALGAQGFSRQDGIAQLAGSVASSDSMGDTGFDAIIHCAFNTGRNIKNTDFKDYVADNILLTQKLAQIPHKKFIFISSIDVYPRNLEICTEDAEFTADDVKGLYGQSKLIAEVVVQNECDNYIIARPSALLGTKKNSLTRVLFEDAPSLTLSADSSFNYVLYADVLEFVNSVISEDVTGIFNLCAGNNVTLRQVVDKYNITGVSFGDYKYLTGNISNKKAATISPAFARTSLENVDIFRNNGASALAKAS